MELSQKLKLGQTQTIAPQLQQSLQILQIPALELSNLVRAEIEVNPILEEIDKEESEEEQIGREIIDGVKKEKTAKDERTMNEEWEEYFRQGEREWKNPFNPEESKRREHLLNSVSVEMTLQEYLLNHLERNNLTEEEREIGKIVIGNINERGILVTNEDTLCENTGLPEKLLRRITKIIKKLDPPGVGAESVRECLMIQLERKNRKGAIEYKLLESYHNELEKRRIPVISKKTGLSIGTIQAAIKALGKLDPNPGSQFGPAPKLYVNPDVKIEKIDGNYIATANNSHIPQLRINGSYRKIIDEIKQNRKDNLEKKLTELAQ